MNVLKHSKSDDLSEFFEDEDMVYDQKIGGRSRGLVTTGTRRVSRGHLDDYFSITRGVLPSGLTIPNRWMQQSCHPPYVTTLVYFSGTLGTSGLECKVSTLMRPEGPVMLVSFSHEILSTPVPLLWITTHK